MRARGGIAIVVAHRPSALAAVDLVGIVQNGRLVAFGPKDKVLSGGTVTSMPQPTAEPLRRPMQVPA